MKKSFQKKDEIDSDDGSDALVRSRRDDSQRSALTRHDMTTSY